MAEPSYFFYDLETSGLDSGHQRVIQFAGQRTDLGLQPLGQPYEYRVQLPDDIIPQPTALEVTGKGLHDMRSSEHQTEAEFARILHEQIFIPGTVAVGFNNQRFDDNFIRHVFWRNFYDPYTWAYQQQRGRWDVYQLALMFRALSPAGIIWPEHDDGQPDNRLQPLAEANAIMEYPAHDAVADVRATIKLVQHLRESNPQLFQYFLRLQDKRFVNDLLARSKPLLWTFNQHAFGPNATSLIVGLGSLPHGKVAVYDLRHSPEPWLDLSVAELHEWLVNHWQQEPKQRVVWPLYRLAPNTMPMLASYQLLERYPDISDRLQLDLPAAQRHFNLLGQHPDFFARLKQAWIEPDYPADPDVDGQLYQGFSPPSDAVWAGQIRAVQADVTQLRPQFTDPRLDELFFRYRARNFPETLSTDEHARWHDHCQAVRQLDSDWWTEWQAVYDRSDSSVQAHLDQLRSWVENAPEAFR